MAEDEYLQAREIIDRFPDLNRSTIQLWAKTCVWIGRAVRTKPSEANAHNLIYHVGDVSAARAKYTPLGPPVENYVTASVVLEKFPKLRRHLLLNWCRKNSPVLGRCVRTEPEELDVRYRYVHLADIETAVAGMRGELPDRFTDIDGVEIVYVEVLRVKHKISLTSIQEWEKLGCPAIGGQLLKIRRLFSWNESNSKRRYISADDEKKIIAGYDQDAKTATRDDPTKWCLLNEAIALGFDAIFLGRHSESGNPARKKKEKPGRKHPSLGRLIRTDRRRVTQHYELKVDGAVVAKVRHPWQVRWWRKDLKTIIESPPPPAKLWVRWAGACREYALSEMQLTNAVNRGRVRSEEFAVADDDDDATRPTLRWFYFRADLEDEGLHLRKKAALPKPGSPERVYIASDGVRWWPEFETKARLGVHSNALTKWRRSCEHLGGKPLSVITPKRALWRSVYSTPRHYREDEREQIYRAMHPKEDAPPAVLRPDRAPRMFPADYFQLKYDIKPDRLKKAQLRGLLKHSEKRGGRWFHDWDEVKERYPDDIGEPEPL